MKALIFNSGLGRRMGDFTRRHHKSMALLSNGETIFARQLRLLAGVGVTEFVITTGPFAEQLHSEAARPHLSDCTFTFVENPIYDQTNYIYSMYLAREHLTGDLLMLHGDLVFNAAALDALIADRRPDLAMVNAALPQPEKDFKARVADGVIREVSVSIADADCHAFQPLYKLSGRAVGLWLDRVVQFCERGDTGVYAENALNEITEEASIHAFSYAGHSINEVDTPDDLARVSAEVRILDFAEQPILSAPDAYRSIPDLLATAKVRRPLLVGGQSFEASFIKDFLGTSGVGYVRFSGYSANPKLEEVRAGLDLFHAEKCDAIIALGGGSAIDVAKGVKLLAAAGTEHFPAFGDQLKRRIPHLCVPTTAGTGSESTHFAVVYINGEKHSIAHDALMPEWVILEPRLLESLPDYHKKASLLDALSQCIESSWARGATEQSIGYAMEGLGIILENFAEYVSDRFDEDLTRRMQRAANLSGKAINLTKTTAPHAMSYGITSLCGTGHGHAAALCLVGVWEHYARLADRETPAGVTVTPALDRLTEAFGASTRFGAVARLRALLEELRLPDPTLRDPSDLERLVASVNQERLSNSPIALDEDEIRRIYESIFAEQTVGAELTIAEVQAEGTRLLAIFDRFCREHELRYFVAYGTLLGAVRHSGPIPWDDDVDVVMPRPDYDRFIETFSDEGTDNAFVFAPGRPDYPVHFAKLISTRTRMSEYLARYPDDYGVFVDIFPLDGVPRRWPRLHKGFVDALQRGVIFSYHLKPAAGGHRSAKQLLRTVLGTIGRAIPQRVYRRLLDRGLRRTPFEGAERVGTLMLPLSLEKVILTKIELEGYRPLPYGDLTVRGFMDSEAILERVYGSTWRTPIKREQAPHGQASWR